MASWLVWTRLALPPGEAHGRILAAARFVFALAAAAHARARRGKLGSADIVTARFVHSQRAQAGKACSVIRPCQKGRAR
jgi:hypothetical protein